MVFIVQEKTRRWFWRRNSKRKAKQLDFDSLQLLRKTTVSFRSINSLAELYILHPQIAYTEPEEVVIPCGIIYLTSETR